MLAGALADAAQRGLLPATDIGWVVDLPRGDAAGPTRATPAARPASRRCATTSRRRSSSASCTTATCAAPAAGLRRPRPGLRCPDQRAPPVDRLPRTGGTHPMTVTTDRDSQHAHRARAAARRAAGRRAAARAARRRRAATRARGDGRPARGLRHPAASSPSRRRCSRSSAARPGPASRRWSTRWSARCDRAGRAPADHPVAGPGAPPRRRRLVRRRPAAARPRAGRPPHRRPARAPAGRRSTPCPQGLAILDAPTSTRSRRATATWPPSCSPPPTCGCSSPRPRGTPTRSRGSSCARPPSARRRSRSCSTARRRTPSRPWPPTWPGCWPAAGSRTRRCSPSTRRRSTTTACSPADHVAEIRGWLASLAGDADARAAVVRQTLDGAVRIADPPGLPGRRRVSPSRSEAAERLRAGAERGVRRGDPAGARRPRPTAPCCAARCWPGGRSSSAPASC